MICCPDMARMMSCRAVETSAHAKPDDSSSCRTAVSSDGDANRNSAGTLMDIGTPPSLEAELHRDRLRGAAPGAARASPDRGRGGPGHGRSARYGGGPSPPVGREYGSTPARASPRP